jgi:DNA gyrase/topoisomerase IV subunit A
MRFRLAVLDTYLAAAERRDELMGVVADAPDPDEACRSVAVLLGITEEAARGVLDMRLRRFSQSEVADARSEHHDIRGVLDRGP